jgi:short-subunit dehydrogenase
MNMVSPETIVLTGAANGIGRALATVLGRRGHRLGLIDRNSEALGSAGEFLRGMGVVASTAVADVTNAQEVRDAVGQFESELGPIDILVAGAGIGGLTLLSDLNAANLRAILDVNVVGAAIAIEAVLPGMIERKQGHIVGISSVAGFRGLPWMAAYSASKAALSTYLEGLRPALKRRGITITTVCPGFVRTALTADTPFRNPVKMLEPEQAAEYLMRAIEKRPRDYVFPLSAKLGMGFLRRLPNGVFDWMMDRAGPKALTTDF